MPVSDHLVAQDGLAVQISFGWKKSTSKTNHFAMQKANGVEFAEPSRNRNVRTPTRQTRRKSSFSAGIEWIMNDRSV